MFFCFVWAVYRLYMYFFLIVFCICFYLVLNQIIEFLKYYKKYWTFICQTCFSPPPHRVTVFMSFPKTRSQGSALEQSLMFRWTFIGPRFGEWCRPASASYTGFRNETWSSFFLLLICSFITLLCHIVISSTIQVCLVKNGGVGMFF